MPAQFSVKRHNATGKHNMADGEDENVSDRILLIY